MGLFREKNLNKISSPEQLDDYIRVAGPGAWLLLAWLLLVLLGFCVWGVFGRLETNIQTAAVSRDRMLTCYLPKGQPLLDGMTVTVEGKTYPISMISDCPQPAPEIAGGYALHPGGFSAGDWVYTASAQTEIPDGVYEAVVTIGRTAPVSFILN